MTENCGTILITGGTGLIASSLASKLALSGRRVLVVSRSARFSPPLNLSKEAEKNVELIVGDASDPQTLTDALAASDAVFHVADSSGMAGAVESAKDFVHTNMLATANLVDALKSPKSRVQKVILGSSTSVYGEGNYHCTQCGVVRPELRTAKPEHGWNPPCPSCKGEITPIETPETAVRNGESIYAVIKKAQEDMLSGTCRVLGVACFTLRYSTVIGAGQSWHNPYTRLVEELAQGKAPELNEDGKQTRNFIAVDDLVAANVLALQSAMTGLPSFNIVTPHAATIEEFTRQMAQSVALRLGRSPVTVRTSGRLVPADVRHCLCDSSKAKAELQFEARSDLKTSIDALVDWYLRDKALV
jgi:dTDP-L-rhamnose 4-epimerase